MNPNAIAPGINPHRITNAQVGAGYRLTTRVPAEPENVALRDAERATLKPEILTTSGGWAPASYETLDFLRRALFSHTSTGTTPDGQRIMLPPTFRVPLTPAFIAWKARQRPERINAAKQKEQRVRQARECIDLWTKELARAASDYDQARRRAFEATAAEYGYQAPKLFSASLHIGEIPPGAERVVPILHKRTKLEFPPLPVGVTYYNPQNLTAELVGVFEGWRLLRSDESMFPHDSEAYISLAGAWGPWAPRGATFADMGKPNCSFRTKTPAPKLEFPPLPAGAEWLNPEKFTPEQVGVVEGWRPLCTLDMVVPRDSQIALTVPRVDWITENGEVEDAGKPIVGRRKFWTYRTKAPIPTR